MKLYDTKLPSVYLKPGQIYIAEKPTLVSTVLGSCLSATMFSRRFRIGAISHGLLPLCKHKKLCVGECHETYKYIDCSILMMIDKFHKHGIKSSEIEVKLFGGANVFISKDNNNGNMSIGTMNIKTALKIIRTVGLNMVTSDLGGSFGRKLYFYTHTGEVLLTRLKKKQEMMDLPGQL